MNIGVTILTPGYIRTNIAVHAVTADGSPMGRSSANIEGGLPADQAAKQILRALAKGKFEAYIGKMGGERMGLLLSRFAPGVLTRMVVKMAPK
jgi:short-subunit dehydrogenase